MIEEKHREKKHKKEKKDKEKKESKERRDKDRSEGKHRDKKDKKEKHRDKKDREKDREKDKDRASTSDEKRLVVPPGSNGAEKLSRKEKEKDKDSKNSAVDKRPLVHPEGYKGQKPSQSIQLAEESKDLRFVQDLGRRISDEAKGAGNQSLEKSGTDPGRDAEVVVFKRNDSGTQADGKDTTNNERNGNGNMDRKTYRDETRLVGNNMLQSLARLAQNRFEGPPRQMENIERKIEEKEKSKEKREAKRGNKHKEKDREKKSHGKDKDGDKEKKTEEKMEKSEVKNMVQDKAKERNKIDTMVNHITKTMILPTDCDTSAAIEGNSRKRKELEVNGFLHEAEARPNKLQKPTSGQPTENGRKLEPCQSDILSISEMQGVPNNFKGAPTPNNFKVENKEHKLNGIIEAQPMPAYPPKQMLATTQADPIEEASKRPPHRDLKYLSQILAVPQMEELSELDNQEWLLGCDNAAPKKPLVGASLDETPQVWAEALKIESADVYALPYSSIACDQVALAELFDYKEILSHAIACSIRFKLSLRASSPMPHSICEAKRNVPSREKFHINAADGDLINQVRLKLGEIEAKKKDTVEGKGCESHGTCAICLDDIDLQEIALGMVS
ncbi:hypothetical protein RJ641_021660 [Dillenia turbinata]|uniref:Uncharacterized protein n=1 Tax=Dillenia turbinata TaxID=194707 RepID=A0AAN8YT61_9MAGN